MFLDSSVCHETHFVVGPNILQATKHCVADKSGPTDCLIKCHDYHHYLTSLKIKELPQAIQLPVDETIDSKLQHFYRAFHNMINKNNCKTAVCTRDTG